MLYIPGSLKSIAGEPDTLRKVAVYDHTMPLFSYNFPYFVMKYLILRQLLALFYVVHYTTSYVIRCKSYL